MDYNYSIIKSSTCTLDFTNKQDYINIYFVLSGTAKTVKKKAHLPIMQVNYLSEDQT